VTFGLEQRIKLSLIVRNHSSTCNFDEDLAIDCSSLETPALYRMGTVSIGIALPLVRAPGYLTHYLFSGGRPTLNLGGSWDFPSHRLADSDRLARHLYHLLAYPS
jgi:hypothetical protein